MKSGVYQIKNIKTNQIYIGSTKSFKDRLNLHRSQLRLNRHYCKQLQLDYNNKDKLIFKILETCNNYIEREQYYLDNVPNLYNECKFAGNTKGRESTIKKAILQYSLQGEIIKEWESAEAIRIAFKLKASSKISNVCDGSRKTAYGFIWKRKDDSTPINTIFIKKGKGIAEVNEVGEIIKTWDRVLDCALEVKTTSSKLCKIMNPDDRMKTHNGRKFIYN